MGYEGLDIRNSAVIIPPHSLNDGAHDMITVETRGKVSEVRTFTTPGDAKAFVVNAQTAANCALIKYTANGRSTFFEFTNGAWVVR